MLLLPVPRIMAQNWKDAVWPPPRQGTVWSRCFLLCCILRTCVDCVWSTVTHFSRLPMSLTIFQCKPPARTLFPKCQSFTYLSTTVVIAKSTWPIIYLMLSLNSFFTGIYFKANNNNNGYYYYFLLSRVSQIRPLGFKFQLCFLLVLWTWASYLNSLSFNFFIFKRETTISIL